ncbi:MAG: hypothetical protein AAGA50_06625 [Pseudomonadota bacterium]
MPRSLSAILTINPITVGGAIVYLQDRCAGLSMRHALSEEARDYQKSSLLYPSTRNDVPQRLPEEVLDFCIFTRGLFFFEAQHPKPVSAGCNQKNVEKNVPVNTSSSSIMQTEFL